MRTIGVQLIGDDGMNSPPAHALAERGIVENVRGFMVYGDYRNDHPLCGNRSRGRLRTDRRCGLMGSGRWLLRCKRKAAARGQRRSREMVEARLPMTFDIAMGVRRTDKEFKIRSDSALSSLAPQIETILTPLRDPRCMGADD